MPLFSSFARISWLITLSFFGIVTVSAAVALSPYMFVLPQDRPGCDIPIPYRVEPVDPRFPLDSKAFQRGVFEAEAVWERGIGKELFIYNQNAALVVRTEFDERQKMTYEAETLKTKISEYEARAETIDKAYEAAVATYRKESSIFKVAADSFNEKLAEYNADVKEWNASGTGTIEEYEALEKRREKLEKEEKSLVATAEKIERLMEDANGLASTLNKNSSDIQKNISIFRERYGEPKPFVQGLYDPSAPSVTVFQFEDKDDLRLVLAHELGHALGIEEHVGSDSSLMYYLMGGQDIEHPTLSIDDTNAYAGICPARDFSKRESLIRYLVLTPRETMSGWDILGILMEK